MKKSKIIEKYEFIDLPELNLKKLYEKTFKML